MPQDLPSSGGGEAGGASFILTGRHVLVALLAFFAVVAGVNGYMMRMAITTMPGLDARNGYDVSQAFNAYIADSRAQDDRGWKVEARIANAGDVFRASIDLQESDGEPVNGLSIMLRLRHPTNKQLDHDLRLTALGRGQYEGRMPSLPGGSWIVLIECRSLHTGELLYASRNRALIKG